MRAHLASPLALAFLLALSWAQPIAAQVPSAQDITQCDDFGGQLGECDYLPFVDALTGAEPQPGCPGVEDPFVGLCVPVGADPSTLESCAFYLASPLLGTGADEWRVCYSGLTGQSPPAGCNDPLSTSPEACASGVLPPAPCGAGQMEVPGLGVCVPDATDPECPALMLYRQGRGPVHIGSDLDMVDPLATVNGVCPGDAEHDHILPPYTVTAGQASPSTDPQTLVASDGPLLEVAGTTESLLVDRTRFVGEAGGLLTLTGVSDVDLVGVDAAGLTLVIQDSHDVRVLGSRLGAVRVSGGDGVVIADTQLLGTGSVLQADGVDGLDVANVRLARNATAPALQAANSTVRIRGLSFTGALVPTTPCVRVADAPLLNVSGLNVAGSCPAGIIQASGTALVADGVGGTVQSTAANGAAFAASGSLDLRHLFINGGRTALDLAGTTAAWSLDQSALRSDGLAFLGLGRGDGQVHGNLLEGTAALMSANGLPAEARPVVGFTNNHVTSDLAPQVVATGAPFDQLVDLHAWRAPENGTNIRGGTRLAGNWWDVGLVLWDGDGDGLAEQDVPLGGSDATDQAPLVPPNVAPDLTAAMSPDPQDPFVRIGEGQGIDFLARGDDPEDGPLSTVGWSLDGEALLLGANFTLPAPAPGTHVAVAIARDSQGATARQAFPFTVLATNAAPSVSAVEVPCGTPAPDVPVLRVGEPFCASVSASDTGGDDPLDLLYLDNGDGVIGPGDIRLGRSLSPPAAPGPVQAGDFDAGQPLAAAAPARLVLEGAIPVLHFGAGSRAAANDLLLGGLGQGARLQPHHALVGTLGAVPCGAALPLGMLDGAALVDTDCSGTVTAGDHRLGDALQTLVLSTDPDLGEALAAAPTSLGRFDRDAAVRTLWTLGVGTAFPTQEGSRVSFTPSTAGAGVLTTLVTDLGETPASTVLDRPVLVRSILPPSARLAVSPSVQGSGLEVFRAQDIVFSDASLAQPATPIVQWSWHVTGPSGTFTGTQRTLPLHLDAVGQHAASLTVTAVNGQSSTATAVVTVRQAPPTPYGEATPVQPRPFGSPIDLTAAGSLDLGQPLVPLGTGLQALRDASNATQAWAIDLDGDGLLDDGEPQLGPTGLAAPAAADGRGLSRLSAFACFVDRDGDGRVSRGDGVEPIFLTRSPCDETAPGDVRLQPALGPAGVRPGGTVIAALDADAGLALSPLPAARLALRDGDVVLDLAGDLAVSADDVRLLATHGHATPSRVLPASFADGGGALSYHWDCLVGCAATSVPLSDEARDVTSFVTSGRKVLQLTVRDATGNRVSQTLDVVVDNVAPVAEFSFAATNPEPGQAELTQLDDVRFDGTLSDDADGGVGDMSYVWRFSDGDVRSGAVVTKRFAAPGTYWANLTVTDGDDVHPLSATASRLVTVVNHLPVPSFQWLPQQPATLTPVAFDGRASMDPDGTIAPAGFQWTIQEGSDVDTVTGPLASHAFARAGTYDVSLRVTDDRGGVSTMTRSVTVANRAPTAVITVDKTVGRAPQELRFSADLSSDPEVQGAAAFASAAWDFGDGATSTQFNPAHTYTRRGQFTVRLTVWDLDGAAATARVNVTMLNEAAVASIVMPASALSNQNLTFKALAFDGDGDPVSYAWDFGDQTTATGDTVTHAYHRFGTYTVTLRANDAGGGETVVTRLMQVASPAPKATLQASALRVKVNEPITFHGNATDDGSVIGHFMDFGDGHSAFASNATHAYTKPGNYTVTYRASDEAGESGAARVQVAVVNPPPRILAIQATPNDPKPGDLILLRATVEDEDAGVRYEWDFKDGALSEQATPVHLYRVPGTFNVVLTVVDAHGARASYGVDVVVGPGGNGTVHLDEKPKDDDAGVVQRLGHQAIPGPSLGLLALACVATALGRRRRLG